MPPILRFIGCWTFVAPTHKISAVVMLRLFDLAESAL
jgi:hypothetical protein